MQWEAGNRPHETMAATSKNAREPFVRCAGAMARNSTIKAVGVWNVLRIGLQEEELQLWCCYQR